MVDRLTHVVVYVADQDRAKAFYCEKLGFELRADDIGRTRWLEVGPREQKDVTFVLLAIVAGPLLDDESAKMLRALVERGTLAGVLSTKDVVKTHRELAARGVEFVSPPLEGPAGVEAVFRDDSGNLFSLRQPR